MNLLLFLLAFEGFWFCVILVKSGIANSLDSSVLHAIYNLPSIFEFPVYLMTQLGNFGVLFMAVLMALVFKRKQIAAILLANGVLAYSLAALAKIAVARQRPALMYSDIIVRLEVATGYGFPSGHTALTTALALGLMPYTPKKYHVLLWLWIAAVAFSRMYLGVHAPLDVLGGFCLGVCVATLTRSIVLLKHGTKQKA